MPVEAIELRVVRMRLKQPFATSEGRTHDRDIVLVHVITDEAEGWGECAALPTPTYSAEYAEGALHVLRHHLAPHHQHLDRIQGHPMAKAALRTALLDADLRTRRRSLADHLGATQPRVQAGTVIGLLPPDELLATVGQRRAEGYRRIKLKVEPGQDLDVIAAVHDQYPDLELWVDANGAYRPQDVEHVQRLADHVSLIEQPFAADDLIAHGHLTRTSKARVGLDESITSAATARTAIALKACTAISLKPATAGGPEQAKAIHDVCARNQIPNWCGGMLETGIGRAAALAVAALPNCTLSTDLSASDRYYEHDLTEPFTLDHDGCLTVPAGPGIGVTPNPDAIQDLTVERVILQPA